MTYVIHARNVNDALWMGLRYLRLYGVPSESRNGPVKVAPGPVVTEYARPTERVMFWPDRDANPFFHLAESLWMLAGRNDVEFVSHYASQMRQYSDNGLTLNGAYGYRWLKHFGIDQIRHVVDILKEDPTSRRAVIQMYDPSADTVQGKDIPCNTVAYFDITDGDLNMTVSNRSNDVVWGCYGANAVHFSVLQEFIAVQLGLEVGRYRQFSNNFHIYEAHWHLLIAADKIPMPFGYPAPTIPLDAGVELDDWYREIREFVKDPAGWAPATRFIKDVAQPMLRAYEERKAGNGDGVAILTEAPDSDWKRAGLEWINRRRYAEKT